MDPFGDRLPTLTTERLVLRHVTAEDVPALYRLFRDPEVMRYWSSPPLKDQRAAAALQVDIEEHFRHRTLFQWGLCRRDTPELVGTCTLVRVAPEHRRAEIGYALGRSYWGCGYMGEAVRALVRFAFGNLGLHRLEADIDPRNIPSLRLVERLGFRREGHLRERYFVGGEIQDAVIYGLLRTEARPELLEEMALE
jgi:RimJ/RimL family protein N-acetyltransferase